MLFRWPMVIKRTDLFGTFLQRDLTWLNLVTKLAWIPMKRKRMVKPSSSFSHPPMFGNLSGIWTSNRKLNIFGGGIVEIFLQQVTTFMGEVILGPRRVPNLPQIPSNSSSVEHMLFWCELTHAVWFGCEMNFRVDPEKLASVVHLCIGWLMYWSASQRGERERWVSGMAASIGWFIWKERNDDVFNHKKVDPLTSYTRGITIKAGIPFCNRKVILHLFLVYEGRLQVWRNGLPPERGCLKINCDAAMKKDDSAASIAVIVWDLKGNLVDGSLLQSEVMAIR